MHCLKYFFQKALVNVNKCQLTTTVQEPDPPPKTIKDLALEKHLNHQRRTHHLIWTMVNVIGSAILYCRIRLASPMVFVRFLEYSAFAVLMINIVYNCVNYLLLLLEDHPIVCTSSQQHLLCLFADGLFNIKGNQDKFKGQPNLFPKPNISLRRTTGNASDLIQTEKQLEKYLQQSGEMFENESKPTNDCKYIKPATMAQEDLFAPYKLAITKVFTSRAIGTKVKQTVDKSAITTQEISTLELIDYVPNLKKWISCRILRKIVNDINIIDKAFKSRGFFEYQLGYVGLQRLKQFVKNPVMSSNIPRLESLLPYLSLCLNQQYLVQRIKNLATSCNLIEYQWFMETPNNPHWNEYLPTDAAIIFHLFCTYLDSQFSLTKTYSTNRPFYSRYVIVSDGKSKLEVLAEVENSANCAILCSDLLKPHFNFISHNAIQPSVYDQNNLFHVILEFLNHLVLFNDSRLEYINLDKYGIDILSILNHTSLK